MASFFNLTLDTTAPSTVTVKINGDDTKTSSTSAVLTITSPDADTSGYQMKIWGDIVNGENPIDAPTTQSDASWETFATSKNIVLTSGDGKKNVYVLVRDDVGNYATLGYLAQTDTITLATTVPVVTINGPDRAKIAKIEGKNFSKFIVSANVPIDCLRVMLVANSSALVDDVTNKIIPSTINGSNNKFFESAIYTGDIDTTGFVWNNGPQLEMVSFDSEDFDPNLPLNVRIDAGDLQNVAGDDGTYCIKVFARAAGSGLWSV